MQKIFSNGPLKDFVTNPFENLLASSNNVFLAAPYFTQASKIVEAASKGKIVNLLIGLNSTTTPKALYEVLGKSNITIRYYTDRFHAKIYIFDNEHALLGSSNLTDGGMMSNREAVIKLSAEKDGETIEEVKTLFADLWESAEPLTTDKLNQFSGAWNEHAKYAPNLDSKIETIVGKAHPKNINISSTKTTNEQLFFQSLRKQIYEQYKPAFNEVEKTLNENNLHRKEFSIYEKAVETNRFLNWVRKSHAKGEEAWQDAKILPSIERINKICNFGKEWITTEDSKVEPDYFDRLELVKKVFSSKENIDNATKDQIANSLLGVHAFAAQDRFTKGGVEAVPAAFWQANSNDIVRVQYSLSYMLFESGDFTERLHDLLYNSRYKLGYFGYFSVLELFGTIKPQECPPMNGRIAKALKFLGYDVKAN